MIKALQEEHTMASSNLNIRVDDSLKKQSEELFKDLGLSMSSAITVFLRTSVNYGGIPFEVKKIGALDHRPDEQLKPKQQ